MAQCGGVDFAEDSEQVALKRIRDGNFLNCVWPDIILQIKKAAMSTIIWIYSTIFDQLLNFWSLTFTRLQLNRFIDSNIGFATSNTLYLL